MCFRLAERMMMAGLNLRSFRGRDAVTSSWRFLLSKKLITCVLSVCWSCSWASSPSLLPGAAALAWTPGPFLRPLIKLRDLHISSMSSSGWFPFLVGGIVSSLFGVLIQALPFARLLSSNNNKATVNKPAEWNSKASEQAYCFCMFGKTAIASLCLLLFTLQDLRGTGWDPYTAF